MWQSSFVWAFWDIFSVVFVSDFALVQASNRVVFVCLSLFEKNLILFVRVCVNLSNFKKKTKKMFVLCLLCLQNMQIYLVASNKTWSAQTRDFVCCVCLIFQKLFGYCLRIFLSFVWVMFVWSTYFIVLKHNTNTNLVFCPQCIQT